MKIIREIKCDHAIEEPKKHPVMHYVNIGNLIIAMCGTCFNALKGQIYEGDTQKYLAETFLATKSLTNQTKTPKNKSGVGDAIK